VNGYEFSDDYQYSVLYAVEFDKIIRNVRIAVQEANTMGNNQYSAAVSSYVNDLRYWFSPSIIVNSYYQ
jgi:hypothetical protein